ncbi:hemerythrin domain-containing protein [Actinoplanes sp. NPDC051411]|uniref:hemerythrin domain-containing protein n=1 Tax=Actinoplanes sp. NPDC051411 TaxID=3155522 RepID=UPI00342B6C26
MLHEHHQAEDELLWPALHARAPLADDLITTMSRQHAAVASAVERVGREMDEASLKELHDVLIEHLDLEEAAVLPLIHDHLTVAEWHAPQEHAMKHGPAGLTDKLLLAGLVLEDATPRERAWFLSEMPPPARLLWRLVGRRRYARRMRAVRGAGPGGR